MVREAIRQLLGWSFPRVGASFGTACETPTLGSNPTLSANNVGNTPFFGILPIVPTVKPTVGGRVELRPCTHNRDW
jgi:hypothetical protein